MPMPLNAPSDAQVRQQVLAQLIANTTQRSGAGAAALVAPSQQATLDAVRMGNNEDAMWSGGYRNDQVRQGNDQMLQQVAASMQAQRDQVASDKALLDAAKAAGSGKGGGHRGGGTASYLTPSEPTALPVSSLASSIGAGLIPLPPAMPKPLVLPAAVTAAQLAPWQQAPAGPPATGPGVSTPAGPAAVSAATKNSVPTAQAATKWTGW